jgi:GNAT superfamily N-acetyltransferase
MIQSCLTFRPATLADIGAVMAIERSPDYERYVARSEEEEHRAMLGSASHAYRLGVGASGAIEAFAVLRGLGDPHLNLYLKRIAVARPGQRLGTAFLSLILDEAFGPLGAERFHLDCFADNIRAQRAYTKLGFTRDGVLRKAYRQADGTRTDLVMMAILKNEWEAKRSRVLIDIMG